MTDTQGQDVVDEEDGTIACCTTIPAIARLTKPVPVDGSDRRDLDEHSAFWTWPIFGPLLFENETSDARDHCANERSAYQYFPYQFKAI